MRRTNVYAGLWGITAALASACSAGPGETLSDGPSEEGTPVSVGVTLQQIEVDGERISFEEHATPEGDVLMMREVVSARRQPLGVLLMQQRPDLTMLEIYHALAPEGPEPHERLVASHVPEVAAMGRQDASVQRVDFEVPVGIEKLSTSTCTSSIYSSALPGAWWSWGDRGIVDNASGFTDNCLDNDCGYYTGAKVIGGFCNDGSVAQSYRAAWDYNGGSWDHATSWWSVPAQTAEYTTMAQHSPSHRYSIDGKGTNPGNYHTRTGVLKPPVPR